METNQNLLSSDLQVDAVSHSHLKETAMWAKFLAVVGMVVSVIIAIFAMFAGTILASMTRTYNTNSEAAAVGATALTIIYLIIAAINFFLALFLFRFAVKMKQAFLSTDQESFNGSLLNLKFVFRMMGIITIIYLAFLALALIIGIGAAAFTR